MAVICYKKGKYQLYKKNLETVAHVQGKISIAELQNGVSQCKNCL